MEGKYHPMVVVVGGVLELHITMSIYNVISH